MANRPPFRPWLRLTSFARPPLPGAPAATASDLVNQRATPDQPRPNIRPSPSQTARPAIPQPQQAAGPPVLPPPTQPPPPPPIELPPIALADPPVATSPKPPPLPQAINSPASKSPRSSPTATSPAAKAVATTPPPSPIAASPKATVEKSPSTPTLLAPINGTSSPPGPLPPASPPNDHQSPRLSVVPPPSPNSGAPPLPTPTESSKVVKQSVQTPVQLSPKASTASPPPLFALPPPLVSSTAEPEQNSPAEAEKRTVSVQDATEKPDPFVTTLNDNGKVKFNLTNRATRMASNGSHKKVHDGKESPKTTSSDSNDNRMVTITMAGDNKGAIMELGSSTRRPQTNRVGDPDRGQDRGRVGIDESESGHGGSENEVRTRDHKQQCKTMAATPLPFKARINSNVQGVNNSILYISTCTDSNPGVQISVSMNPASGHGIHHEDHATD